MSLVLLYLGEECVRKATEDDAKKSGEIGHTESKPAMIEITPDGGGRVKELTFDSSLREWIQTSCT